MPSLHHTIPSLTPKDIARFWGKVDKTPGFGPNGHCWRWTGTIGSCLYGSFGLTEQKGIYIISRAHRVSWTLAYGCIPQGICVCHHCDTPLCVKPAHLFLGADTDNVADRDGKGRQTKGEHVHSAKLTSEDVIEIRQRYAAGNIKQSDLAFEYSVDTSTICLITTGKRWAHVHQCN